MPVKLETSSVNYNFETEVLICPVCKCESFTDRARLCEHILICEKQSPDIPVIINYGTVNLKTEKIDNYYSKFDNAQKDPINKTGILRETNNFIIPNDYSEIDPNQLKTESTVLFACDMDKENPSFNLPNRIFKDENDNESENDIVEVASISNIGMPFKFKIHIADRSTKKSVATSNNSSKNIPENSESQKTINNRHREDVIKINENNKVHTCDLCVLKKLYQFKTRKSLLQHMSRIHNHNKNYFAQSAKCCKFCSTKLQTYHDLLEHYRECNDLKVYKKKSPKKITGINAPKKSVKQLAKSMKCCMCRSDKCYTYNLYLEHIKSEHNLNKAYRFPRDYRQCIYCTQILTNFRSLELHNKNCA